MLRDGRWNAAMPDIFFCPRTWRRTCATTGIGNRAVDGFRPRFHIPMTDPKFKAVSGRYRLGQV
jgi:hypothetical protein